MAQKGHIQIFVPPVKFYILQVMSLLDLLLFSLLAPQRILTKPGLRVSEFFEVSSNVFVWY